MPKRNASQTAFGADVHFLKESLSGIVHVADVDDRASWVVDVEKKLQEMSRLKSGWDSYDAEAPNKESLKLLRDLLRLLEECGLQPSSTGPSVEGGGSFSFFGEAKDRYAEIEIENNREVNIFVMKIFPSGRKTKTWGFQYERANLVESIRMVIKFLAGEDVPRKWLLRFEKPMSSTHSWRWK